MTPHLAASSRERVVVDDGSGMPFTIGVSEEQGSGSLAMRLMACWTVTVRG